MRSSVSRAAGLWLASVALGCGPPASGTTSSSAGTTSASDTGSTNSTSDTGDADDASTETTAHPCPHGCFDEYGWQEPPPDPCMMGSEDCFKFDILIVVDNSETMAPSQRALAAAMAGLVDGLSELVDFEDESVSPDVNILFTSTDLQHPPCAETVPPGYQALAGAPQDVPCIDRLDDFTSRGSDPIVDEDACTVLCPFSAAPANPFAHFEGPKTNRITNVPGNNIVGALQCLAPMGINGCGYVSPLEAMVRALDPAASWNSSNKPFLRPEARALAIVLVTGQADCSLQVPEGEPYFVDDDSFWSTDPASMTPAVSRAACWNAGVDCGVADVDGVYPDCTSLDTGVLHPSARYLERVRDELLIDAQKEVVMLALTGIPPVTAHNPSVPFEPTLGGVQDLVYREWIDGPVPDGDLGPGESDLDAVVFEHGPVAPGCVGLDGMGELGARALPPVRILEVCEGLESADDRVRCGLESVCDMDDAAAFKTLVGMLQAVILPD